MATSRPSHVFPWNDQLDVRTSLDNETNATVLQYDSGAVEERPNSLVGSIEALNLAIDVTQEESVHVRKWLKMVQSTNNRFNFYLPEDPGDILRCRIENWTMRMSGPIRRFFTIKVKIVLESPQY